MDRKRITGDELNARAKTNSYKRGYIGKKTIVETAISTGTTLRKIKMERWMLYTVRERCLHPKTIDTEVCDISIFHHLIARPDLILTNGTDYFAISAALSKPPDLIVPL